MYTTLDNEMHETIEYNMLPNVKVCILFVITFIITL